MRGEHIHFKYALGLRLPIHTTVEPHFVLVIRCAKLNLNQSNEFNSKINFFLQIEKSWTIQIKRELTVSHTKHNVLVDPPIDDSRKE